MPLYLAFEKGCQLSKACSFTEVVHVGGGSVGCDDLDIFQTSRILGFLAPWVTSLDI